MNLSEFIACNTFFDGLSEAACRSIASRMVLRRFEKGKILFHENQTGTVVYFMVAGMVKLSRTTEDGAESVVRLMGPRDLFGEVILFERNTYPVTATCLTKTKVAVLQRADLRGMLADESFRLSFIEFLFSKQRALVSRIQQLTAMDIAPRLFYFLRSHYGDSRRIEMTVTKKDVAAALDITPESLSRLLRRLRDDGVLTWEDNVITIHKDTRSIP